MKGFASKLKGVGGDALSKSRDAAGALKGAGAAINARRKSTAAGAPAAEESYTPPSYSPPPTTAAASSSAAPDATYTVTDGVWTKVDASGATTVVTPPADLAAQRLVLVPQPRHLLGAHERGCGTRTSRCAAR